MRRFSSFGLLPGLTIAENMVLPMEFCGTYAVGDRLPRAMELLDRVGIRAQADKLPSALSGGEQLSVYRRLGAAPMNQLAG